MFRLVKILDDEWSENTVERQVFTVFDNTRDPVLRPAEDFRQGRWLCQLRFPSRLPGLRSGDENYNKEQIIDTVEKRVLVAYDARGRHPLWCCLSLPQTIGETDVKDLISLFAHRYLVVHAAIGSPEYAIGKTGLEITGQQ